MNKFIFLLPALQIKQQCTPLIIGLVLGTFFLFSCTKNWLDAKSDKKLVQPTTIADLQAILDNQTVINNVTNGTQALSETGTDNFYITDAHYKSLGVGNGLADTRSYIFEKDIFAGLENVSSWNLSYKKVFWANIVLDELNNLKPDISKPEAANVKGSALFIKAHSYYWLAQLFAQHYNKNTAAADLGIPLKNSSDVNIATTRSSVAQTYETIIEHLKEAANLLPDTTAYKTRPSKAAAFALLARVYLTTNNYDEALVYADSCLALNSKLMDYNNLNPALTYPVTVNNVEVLYLDENTTSLFNPAIAKIFAEFYNSYHNDDLRKKIYFKTPVAGISFNGSYSGSSRFFGGIAIDEIYFTKSECLARKGNITAAISTLNLILKTRWSKTVTYTDIIADNANTALQIILTERRKSLLFRGLRWVDLRRLNYEGLNITVSKTVNGITYALSPNSNKYVYPIPDDIILLTGIQQNFRQ